jgi:hypothetical protein
MRRFRFALASGCAAALAFFTATALAGSGVGDVFTLGQTNTVDAQSVLTGATTGTAELRVQNTSGATALALDVDPGVPPFRVSSSTTVPGLNADLLDGLNASAFWRLTGNAGTPSGSFIGTTDTRPFAVRTHNKDALYVDPNQNVFAYRQLIGYGGFTGLLGTFSSCAPLVAVLGCANKTGATGVLGQSSGGGLQIGVEGSSNSVTCPSGSAGVAGCSGIGNNVGVLAPSSSQVGVRGISDGGIGVSGGANGGRAVEGLAKTGVGVFGKSTSYDGVYGSSSGPAGAAGVEGFSSGAGDGVLAGSTDGPGLYAYSTNGSAGYFEGDVYVTGTFSAPTKNFKIDDPLDPAHKYLQHTSVESPDMMDIYNGNVTTDAHGFATVRLPAWFQALNRSFRYQLTIVGTRGWNARVVEPIAHNRFTIQSDRSRVEVSWQVTGIRHDPYANAHRTQVIVPKAAADQGKYLYPLLYGKPRRAEIEFELRRRER